MLANCHERVWQTHTTRFDRSAPFGSVPSNRTLLATACLTSSDTYVVIVFATANAIDIVYRDYYIRITGDPCEGSPVIDPGWVWPRWMSTDCQGSENTSNHKVILFQVKYTNPIQRDLYQSRMTDIMRHRTRYRTRLGPGKCMTSDQNMALRGDDGPLSIRCLLRA